MGLLLHDVHRRRSRRAAGWSRDLNLRQAISSVYTRHRKRGLEVFASGGPLDICQMTIYDFHQSTSPKSDVMNSQLKIKADDTRARIMDTAEALFRRLGFAKTAVADIAAE